MQNPLVSVKMITYNHAPYIAQAIEGVLMQKTNFPFELVIGEDCSSDGTREIVFDYAKRYPDIIRVITSEKNVGASENSSRTNKACQGKYLAWCEGDDYWHREDKLELQVNLLEADSSYGMAHSEIDLLEEKSGKVIKNFHNHRNSLNNHASEDLFYDILLDRYLVRTCTVCIRREIYSQIIESEHEVFMTNRFLLKDQPLWLEVSKRTKIYYIDQSLATYRRHSGGVSCNPNIYDHVKFTLSVLDMIMYYIKKYSYEKRVPKNYLDSFANIVLSHSFNEMDYALASKVQKIRGELTFKLWLLYLGSKNSTLNYILRPIVNFKREMNQNQKS
jgi:glycosyltransferase involved in cell wall biosynthesis